MDLPRGTFDSFRRPGAGLAFSSQEEDAMSVDETRKADPSAGLREEALKRLKKRQDFHAHARVFTLVNAALVIIWAVTTPDIFFWPIFPIAFWGIGLVMNAWDVYHAGQFSEEQVSSEIERLRRHA
jgi:hypothetical protein